MAGTQRTTGLFRILLMVGGMMLLVSMFGNARSQHDETLITRLSNTAAVLMNRPDFEKAEADGERVVLTYADGTTEALAADGPMAILTEGKTIRYTWKAGGDVFFILGGVAEVWEGYVFSRDATLTMPGGIERIERVDEPVTGYCCYHIAARP